MAKRTMNKARLLGAALLALVPAACGTPPAERPPLADARIGGPFTLVDEDGRPFGEAQLKGRYRLIYFGYTFCPDVCPVDVQTLMAGLKRFEAADPARAAKVQPLFVTVDPARDTAPVLKQFTAAFHPRLIGLTGTEAQIDTVAKQYAIYHRRMPPTPGAAGYLVDHSRQAMLFGPAGAPIALVPQDKDADAVAAELARWVR